jgi:hypothetical protein
MTTYTNDFDQPVEMPKTEQGIAWVAEREGETIARGEDLSAFALSAFDGDMVRAYDVLSIMYREGMIEREYIERLTEPYRRGRRMPAGVEPARGVGPSEDYVEPLTDDDRRRTDRYFSVVDRITASWQHLTDAINVELERERTNPNHPHFGVERRASVWQTGGMCMCIGWAWKDHDDVEWEAMLGSHDGPLEHDRAESAKSGGYSLSCGPADEQMTGEAPIITLPMFSARNAELDERAARYLVALATAMERARRSTGEPEIAQVIA